MDAVNSRSGRGTGVRAAKGSRPAGWSGTLAAVALLVLAACEPAPASQPRSLLSTRLPIEPDTATIEPMELNPAPVGTPAPAEDTSFAGNADEGDEEDDSSPYAYPAWEGYDLDCADVGHSVRVTGDDPHGLDRDGDGWGCESY